MVLLESSGVTPTHSWRTQLLEAGRGPGLNWGFSTSVRVRAATPATAMTIRANRWPGQRQTRHELDQGNA